MISNEVRITKISHLQYQTVHEYEKIRNFIPEVVKIQKGDNVKWINVSKDFHHLYFFGVLSDLSKVEIVE